MGNLLGVCFGCHNHIHLNVAWAEENGFLRKSWDQTER